MYSLERFISEEQIYQKEFCESGMESENVSKMCFSETVSLLAEALNAEFKRLHKRLDERDDEIRKEVEELMREHGGKE